MTASWIPSSTQIGIPPIEDTNTTNLYSTPLGTIVKARHATYGEGEFIFLLGVASTVVGSLVRYNATTWQTALVVSSSAVFSGTPLAVAMSANVASQYGWYQIDGLAIIKKTAVQCLPQVPVYISATAGRIKVLLSAGLQVLGARSANLTTVTTTTSTLTVLINRPHAQGQIV